MTAILNFVICGKTVPLTAWHTTEMDSAQNFHTETINEVLFLKNAYRSLSRAIFQFFALTTTACQHCGQTLTIDHILLECTVLQQSRDEYYTVDSLRTLFETIPEACIIEFLRETGFYYLI